jgi:hypothetical protein
VQGPYRKAVWTIAVTGELEISFVGDVRPDADGTGRTATSSGKASDVLILCWLGNNLKEDHS